MQVFSLSHLGAGVLLALTAGSAYAGVRVIHASPDTPPVDVYVNAVPGAPGASPAISNLPFTQSAGYVPLPTGSYDFRVTPAGVTSPVAISALGVALDGSTDYTIAAIDFLANIRPLVLIDNNVSNPTRARVRFVHAAPDVPQVDIALNNGGSQGTTLFDNSSFGAAASEGYIEVPGGTYNLGVFLQNGALALPVNNLSLENGRAYTVFALGSLQQGNVQAAVYSDPIPAPAGAALLGCLGLATLRRRR
jgi:hypothetical protein